MTFQKILLCICGLFASVHSLSGREDSIHQIHNNPYQDYYAQCSTNGCSCPGYPTGGGCGGYDTCEWLPWCPWGEWDTCTRTCAGGTQSRCRQRCRCCPVDAGCDVCPPEGSSIDFETRDCNEICYGGDWNDNQEVCNCNSDHYGYCCEHKCTLPEYCKYSECTSSSNYICVSCHNETALQDAYHLDTDGRCYAKCNWLGHWCFPGICDNSEDYLKTTCECIEGFTKITPDKETTKCILNHDPDLLTCRSAAESIHGEIATSPFLTNSTDCSSTGDGYVNFIPQSLSFLFDFVLDLPQDPPSEEELHVYVQRSAFGIVESSVEVTKYSSNGDETKLTTISLPNADSNCTVEDIDRENPVQSMVSCYFKDDYTSLDLDDGEKVCHKFRTVASGYVVIEDLKTQTDKRYDEYGDTMTEAEKCFVSDFTNPDHCANVEPTCELDVLNFGTRIRRSSTLIIRFDGWFDPEPTSNVATASGIKEYDVELREIVWTPYNISADFKAVETHKSKGEPVIINLEDRGQPSMYAIYLWALDNTQESSNYRIARRFVLADNTSTVMIDDVNPIIPLKASKETDFQWQTVITPIKLDWTKHFFNTWHRHTNYLLPITRDGNVTGVFDQENGELPISGTPNVDGIINFMYAYERTRLEVNDTQAMTQVPDPLQERLTIENLQIVDGDTVKILIQATDIMNNTLTDQILLYIDSTSPESEMSGLTKDGYTLIYAHNSTDLSEMNMTFKALDIHSGLKQVKWSLGTEPGMADIGHGALPVIRLNENETCVTENCYCPSIGSCQMLNFTVPLEGLIGNGTHEGDHNREYFFTFEIMNEAHLFTYDEFVIWIDISPPEVGYVFDGPRGSQDRDFQSHGHFDWNWLGFIDHESGILKYHYGIGERCFMRDEISDLSYLNTSSSDLFLLGETTESFFQYDFNKTGTYYMSVIAFNGAMDPSEAACSNGIVFDNTAPAIQQLQISPVSFPRSIICGLNGSVWFLNPSGIIQILQPVTLCLGHCLDVNITDHLLFVQDIVNGTAVQLDEETSNDICANYPVYTSDTIIYFPSPHIEITWRVVELESQILDYLIGFSEDVENFNLANLNGFQSTNNRTHYKCVQCGFGQGDVIVVILQAINKAGLETTVHIGPVIIDMTPPIYNDGIKVYENGTDVILAWDLDSFTDAEEESILLHYEWSLGTFDNPSEVHKWETKIYHYNYGNENEDFHITFSKSKLQHHDQGKGKHYLFHLKSYNTAQHYITVASDTFTVASNALPVGGIVYHTNRKSREIAYQANLDYLCSSWVGFSEIERQATLFLGIGTDPFSDNVLALQIVNNTGEYCFENLHLISLTHYYFYIILSDGHSNSEASSKGIFVATSEDIYSEAKVDNGPYCPDTQLGTSLLYENITLTNDTDPFKTTFKLNLSSWMVYTIEIEIHTGSCKQCFDVFINGDELLLVSWKYGNTLKLYYLWEMKSTINHLEIISHLEAVVMSSITVYRCIQDKPSQLSKSQLISNWNFKNIASHVSHYEIAFFQQQCHDNLCIKVPATNYISVEKGTFIAYQIPLMEGNIYQTHIRPCFRGQCLDPITASSLVIDTNSPIPKSVSASVFHHTNSPNVYSIEAKWEPFVQHTKDGYGPVSLYDWSVTLDEAGHTHILPWLRIWQEEIQDELLVNKTVTLPVHRDKLMYFAVRCQGLSGKVTVTTTLMEVVNEISSAVPQVFDLPATLHLDPLKDILHSANLGPKAQELYSLEVDFSSDVTSISGGVLGVDCGNYNWALQDNTNANCFEHMESISCISVKETVDNVVEFNRLSLQSAQKYYICVHPTGSACERFFVCSNGFVIDTHPPVGGTVEIGLRDTPIQSETTITEVHWTGFYDIEEETIIPRAHGISYYQVSIGSSPGEEDIYSYTTVGYTEHMVVNNISMTSGYIYFANVRGCDHARLCTIVTSNGLLVDGTPPTPGYVNFYVNRILSEAKSIVISFSGFEDRESGITETLVGIGSTENSIDVMPFIQTKSSVYYVPHNTLPMYDGNFYYAKIKAINKVGLWQVTTSSRLLFDSSPPNAGQIHIREEGQNVGWYLKQNQYIDFYWRNFSDPHTGIALYRVAIGTKQGLGDVMTWRDVGLTNSFRMYIHLPLGQPHYISVEACNGALLCSTAHTPPVIVDKSPPVPGYVIVGNNEQHEHWQSSRTFLSAKWVGCFDLESGIHHFEWCVGTSNATCDIIELHNVHSATSFVKTDINLTVTQKLYVNIVAFNNVGQHTMFNSEFFLIDHSAPVLISEPKILSHTNGRPNMQTDRSYISVSWNFQDKESPIIQHSVSLVSHHDGYVPLSNIIFGDISSVTLPLPVEKRLEDGTEYQAVITSCNAARLCTSGYSKKFLVDSSKPIIGDFAEDMAWRNTEHETEFDLIWENFADPHSPIYRYILSVSSAYNGHDLSGGYVEHSHNLDYVKQSKTVKLKEIIEPNSKVVVSIFAQNQAGLFSDVLKRTLYLFVTDKRSGDHKPKSGPLEIEKHSCDIHYCTLDCTCSPMDQPCIPDSAPAACVTHNSTDELLVYDGIKEHITNVTASSMCLQAHWYYTDDPTSLSRFTWSVSQKDHSPGFGIFDTQKEKYWFDVELYDSSLYCMPGNRSLMHSESYVYHIRAWYNNTAFVHAISVGVLVDVTPPNIRLGKNIVDMDVNFENEIHITTDTSGIYSDWTDVFEDPETGIMYYEVSIGTSFGGNEILESENIGLNTTMAYTSVILAPGERYFTTVHAFNNLGMVSYSTSKGFMVDLEKPLLGNVYTNKLYQDKKYHQSYVTASWSGFVDRHSYIQEYFYKIDVCNSKETSKGFISNGLKNSINVKLESSQQGDNNPLCVYVFAVDAAGFKSDIVSSHSFYTDSTSPELIKCTSFMKPNYYPLICDCSEVITGHYLHMCNCTTNKLLSFRKNALYHVQINVDDDPGFEAMLELGETVGRVHFERTGFKHLEYTLPFISTNDIMVKPVMYFQKVEDMNIPLMYNFSVKQCIQSENIHSNVTTDALKITQPNINTIVVTFAALDKESFVQKVQLGIGTTATGAQLMPITDISTSFSSSLQLDIQHTLVVYPTLIVYNKAGLWSYYRGTGLKVDLTPPVITNIQVSVDKTKTSFKIAAQWNVTEEESTVTDCGWMIGHSKGASDILPLEETDTLVSSSVVYTNLTHGTKVHVTVTCFNKVSLTSSVYAVPVSVIASNPGSEEAYTRIYPKQTTHYKAESNTQTQNDLVDISHHGFTNEELAFVHHYEVKLGENGEWNNIGKLDHIRMDDASLLQNEVPIRFRAVNTKGMCSNDILSWLYVNTESPALKGKEVEWQLTGNTIHLQWDNVFDWDMKYGTLKYELFVGTIEGVADLLKAFITTETEVRITSTQLSEVKQCSLIIHAITPAGLIQTKRQIILLLGNT